MLSGNEFVKDIDDHTPMSSLPPSPPTSPPQPFWMRAHRPELALSLLSRDPHTDNDDDLPQPRHHRHQHQQQICAGDTDKRLNEYKNDLCMNQPPNVFNVFLFAVTGFCVIILSIVACQYFGSLSKLNQLKNSIANLQQENVKLLMNVNECQKVNLAYKHAADMQIANQEIASGVPTPNTKDDAAFKQINEINRLADISDEFEIREPRGRKVWTGDGFILQSTHLPPKKQYKYDDLCDKQIRDDLFSEYTSEYCEKVRKSKRPPVHSHAPRSEDIRSNEPIFTEDFIDPNKFNHDISSIYRDMEKSAEIDELIDDNSDDDDDVDFEVELQAPLIIEHNINYNSLVPSGYNSFEDVLLKMDEHMEQISFHTSSCYAKYKKLKEHEEQSRKAISKFEKQQKPEKTKKKYKKREEDKREKKDEKKEEKRDKRDRKYQEKKNKNFKRN